MKIWEIGLNCKYKSAHISRINKIILISNVMIQGFTIYVYLVFNNIGTYHFLLLYALQSSYFENVKAFFTRFLKVVEVARKKLNTVKFHTIQSTNV